MGSRTAPAGRGTITGRAVVSRNASRLGHRRASLRAALLHGAPQSVQLGRRQRFDLLTELTQDGLLLLVRLVSWLQPLECADEALGCAAAGAHDQSPLGMSIDAETVPHHRAGQEGHPTR